MSAAAKSKDVETHCLPSLLRSLFNQELGDDRSPKPDVLFIVGENRIKVEAHKFVLSLRSTVFNKMFKEDDDAEDEESDEEGENSGLEMSDVNKDALMNVLRYMYCDELSFSENQLALTYQLSDRFKVIGLCESLLARCQTTLSIDNALILYDQLLCMEGKVPADEYTELFESALDIVKMHTFLAFRSASFPLIRKETLLDLLDADFLFIKEIELFLAAMRWITTNCKTADEQKATLRSIKNLIRFPLMSKSQFDYAILMSQKCFPTNEDQLFSALELNEFVRYFQNGDNNQLKLTDYNSDPRRSSLVIKIDYDSEQECYRMYDPFNDDSPNKFGEYNKLSDSMDSRTFAASMKKKFGKDYNKDCTLKRSKQLTNRTAGKKTGKEDVYLFQIKVFAPVEDLTDNNLSFEFYQNGVRKYDVNWRKYLKDGDGVFSFDPPLLISLGKYYRLEFRTVDNVSFSLAFDVNQISVEDETSVTGKMLDVQLIADDVTDYDMFGDLLFYYHQPN